ncbi:hypothetical protein APY04_3254 [Hyphomicrobium sulfonivorans]|uniref:Uncharacterized protein n=2 Tax=Hyphomicrobium sulfonivorans TaxID=121290 RepID=A0A109B9C4_HYPSL|nr:hypothetical protein APY04_3254 [Hyphomicrobium sulfonivorans]
MLDAMQRSRPIAFLALAALLSTAPLAVAQEQQTQKIVPRAGFAIAPLPTDEPVRDGMDAIRDLVKANHGLAVHRSMTPEQGVDFAGKVHAEAAKIRKQTKLSGEALDRLSERLTEIEAGADEVEGKQPGADPADGMMQIDAVLEKYPTEFDHPGWVPVKGRR